MDSFKRLLAWAQRNERHLGAILFVFGFVTDLFTFAFLSPSVANLAFIGYLLLAAFCTFVSYVYPAGSGKRIWIRAFSVIAPLGAQYAIGSLLSGFLIFYTKSAAVIVSWPFLVLLAAVFIGNEYFRTYYKHLAFQLVLFFFALYAYSIFALPILLQRLGPIIFLSSTAISGVVFSSFLLLISRIRRSGFARTLRYVIPATGMVIALMTVSYFTGLIPPIPLSLAAGGVYHSIEHRDGAYVVTAEAPKPWWDPRPEVVHHVSGTPLYAFSSVTAPFSFDASVVHVWERYDPTQKRWVERTRVAFLITGGRDGGYRGYSEVLNPEAGKWRISIETTGGQVIGRIYVTVVESETPPAVREEFR
ncbi:MAG: DUF2914 domain-containing protein [Bacillota bacterium]